jgi:exodeoxyribonuclease III
MSMRILSWNINSVRKRLPLLLQIAANLAPDVICLQEIKGENSVFPAQPLQEAGYVHQAVRGMKAYNGVAILARIPFKTLPIRNWVNKDDARHLAVELAGGVELHNFYVPAGGDIPDTEQNDKFAHKLAFMSEMEAWAGREKNKPRIVVGDLNVAPLPDDVWSHKQLLDVVSHTPVETEGLLRMQERGLFIDTHRTLQPAPEKLYTWWSYRAQDWAASNKGRRLDHIWLSASLQGTLKNAGVYKDARGWADASDHAPIWADLSL